jgi:hypothetical protein
MSAEADRRCCAWGVVEKKHEWVGKAAGGSAKQWAPWSMPPFLRMRGGTPLRSFTSRPIHGDPAFVARSSYRVISLVSVFGGPYVYVATACERSPSMLLRRQQAADSSLSSPRNVSCGTVSNVHFQSFFIHCLYEQLSVNFLLTPTSRTSSSEQA